MAPIKALEQTPRKMQFLGAMGSQYHYAMAGLDSGTQIARLDAYVNIDLDTPHNTHKMVRALHNADALRRRSRA